MATKPKLIKVCLTNLGEDTETPWAYDLGDVRGGKKVKLANVPFMHAKPTWGDTIVVKYVDGMWTWDRDGVPWSKVGTRIAEDGEHWAMIVDYDPHPGEDDAFGALAKACRDGDVVCEGAWGPEGAKPGRVYLAVPDEMSDVQVMAKLRARELPCELVQVHPAPPVKKKKVVAAKKRPKKPVAKKKRR
ncbi:MAG TPA: hypothetical protein VLB44_25725 [Kofleriaceae bacterium]|nr:hypothetical protein [Kofleriaceae bacterium]